MPFASWIRRLASRGAPRGRASRFRPEFYPQLWLTALEERRVLAAAVTTFEVDTTNSEAPVIDTSDSSTDSSNSDSTSEADSSPTSDDNGTDPAGPDADAAAALVGQMTSAANTAPVITSLTVTPDPVAENGIVTLTGTFDDPDLADLFIVTVDWGHGEVSETFVILDGSRSFEFQHQYLDDNPTGTPEDVYTITVTITDNQGGSHQQTVQVTVENVAPVITSLEATPNPVDQNGTVTLQGEFTDPGTLDTYIVKVDWGQGQVSETFVLPAGTRDFEFDHQYLDAGEYTVHVTLIDDDGGIAEMTTTVTVENVAPQITELTVTPDPVDENGTVTLTGKFTDPGTLDSFIVQVDWGHGEASETFLITDGSREFQVTHLYLDDNPSGTPQDTYTITVTITDNHGGSHQQQVQVVVQNVPPVITVLEAAPDPDAAPGTVVLTSEFLDPGTLDTFTVEIDWGDGQPVQVESLPVGTRDFQFNYVYAENGVYTITVTLTDDDLGVAVAMIQVTVSNVPDAPPAAPAIVDLNVTPETPAEGQTATLTGTFSDPDAVGIDQVLIDWGDGTPVEQATVNPQAGGGTFTAPHVYRDNGTYTVEVTLIDNNGGVAVEQLTVTVLNVAPTISELTTSPLTINEGGTVSLNGTFVDPGLDDTHLVSINWGDGTTIGPDTFNQQAGGGSFSAGHVYRDNGTFEVTVTVTDKDGGQVVHQLTVTVLNVAPTITELTLSPSAIDEGGTVSLTGAFIDPGILDTHEVWIDWGDGSPLEQATLVQEAGGGSFSASHVYLDNGPLGQYTITIRVVDKDDGQTVADVTAAVRNVDPVITQLSAATTVERDGTVNLQGAFIDAGVLDTHEVWIDWGDGSPLQLGVVVQGSGSGTILASHQYPSNGTYTITATLFDNDGGSNSSLFMIDVSIFMVLPPQNGSPGTSTGVLPPSVLSSAVLLVDGQQAEPVGFHGGQFIDTDDGASMPISRDAGAEELEETKKVAAREKRFVLRIVLPGDREGENIVLADQEMDNLHELWKRLPDNRYRIYQIQEDDSERLVIEVYVARGLVVDPDESGSTQDRPPMAHFDRQPGHELRAEREADELDRAWENWSPSRLRGLEAEVEEPDSPQTGADASPAVPSSLVLGATLAALPAGPRRGSWRQRLDRAMERLGRNSKTRLRSSRRVLTD